jgi:hypothetical protein
MTNRSLWRLDGATDTTLVQPARLEQGLRLHLQYTELTTVLMQIGVQQQAYVRVGECDGCAQGRCLPGCYVELLRRLLRVCFDACTLQLVAGGLAKRPYGRAVLAWPTANAAPLADLSLTDWSEARLIVQWRGSSLQIACAALLAVGADGPDPAAVVRAVGWQAWTLPGSLGRQLANSALPPSLPFPRAWPYAPTLLWPRPAVPGHREQGEEASSGDDRSPMLTAPTGALLEI